MGKLQPPRGTHDYFFDDQLKYNKVIDLLRQTAVSFGFSEAVTPIFEHTEVFKKTLGDASDIVHKEMYTFEDKGETFLTLRPEGTAPLARALVSQGLARNVPLKVFYHGPMFRYERPQKGRMRQFHQVGVEVLGAKPLVSDLDAITSAQAFLGQLGIISENNTTLEINSLGDNNSRNNYRDRLIEYFKSYEKELSEDSQRRLATNPLRILDSKNSRDQEIAIEAPKLYDCLNDESKVQFDTILENLTNLSIPFSINHQLVRGLDYYSHCVFEYKCNTGLGAQNTVLAGGRYDHLISQMGGPKLSGVGWAAGIERLILTASFNIEKQKINAIIPLAEGSEKLAQKLLFHLRCMGLPSELIDSGNSSKRFKKADKLGGSFALVIGDEELSQQKVTIKNLKSGKQKSHSFDSLLSFSLKQFEELVDTLN